MTRRCALQAGHGGQCLPVKTALPEPMLGECRIAQTKVGLSRNGNPCAWCLREQGVEARVGDSHGICERHLDEFRRTFTQLKAELAARKEGR